MCFGISVCADFEVGHDDEMTPLRTRVIASQPPSIEPVEALMSKILRSQRHRGEEAALAGDDCNGRALPNITGEQPGWKTLHPVRRYSCAAYSHLDA